MQLKLLLGLTVMLVSITAYAEPTTALFFQSNILLTLLSFFGVGILLAFTPCVLPMVPILSAILIGQEQTGTRRATQLSIVFILSMAFTYALAGIAAGYLGSTLQTIMQKPWIIISFSMIFVLMALSMFGFFNVTLPSFLQTRLHQSQNKLKQGSYVSVAIMGILSTLIASPCITAPLISVLTFISQTGSAVEGGFILFFLALGMGLPLLLFGIGQAALLPKAGSWMNIVKSLFGIMMLAMAIWMLSRVISENIALYLWSALLIISPVALGALDFQTPRSLPPILQGIGIFALIYGAVLLTTVSHSGYGNISPQQMQLTHRPPSALFQYVTTQSELDKKLEIAKQNHKPVLIEFFATWCPDCKAVDRDVLSDPQMQKAVRAITALRVDVSERNAELSKMMEKYKVFGVPTMVLYDSEGKPFDYPALDKEITKNSLQLALQNIK